MQVKLKIKSLKLVIKALGKASSLIGYASYAHLHGDPEEDVEIDLSEMSIKQMEIVRDTMKVAEEAGYRRVSLLINALSDPENKSVPSCAEFPRMFMAFMKKLGTPWLFQQRADLTGVAYAVLSVEYISATRLGAEPYARINLGYNTKLAYKEFSLTINSSDCRQSVPKILQSKQFVVEDEELRKEYETLIERFQRFLPMQAEQFWVRGQAALRDPDDNDGYWWTEKIQSLNPKGRPTKAVLDMESSLDRGGRHTTARATHHSSVYGSMVDIPTHPVLPVFSLVFHKYAWVNVKNMGPYKYEENIQDRLVLPASHRRLIGALVSNLEVLKAENEVEDKSRLIRAKASSNVIIAMGPPGTGKTLTTECYAEQIKRPIYEVSSGQLGIDAKEVESVLEDVLARAVRLRMVLLLNEADVFIMKRGTDIRQNAIVGVFLRHLEYHNGLVFMTTNRADDVDEAILNRAIAQIRYGIPKLEERKKLWALTLKEFNVSLSKKDMDEVAHVFPEVVGRDILMLTRLTSRLSTATGAPFDLDLLKECAIFKDIETAEQIRERKEQA